MSDLVVGHAGYTMRMRKIDENNYEASVDLAEGDPRPRYSETFAFAQLAVIRGKQACEAYAGYDAAVARLGDQLEYQLSNLGGEVT